MLLLRCSQQCDAIIFPRCVLIVVVVLTQLNTCVRVEVPSIVKPPLPCMFSISSAPWTAVSSTFVCFTACSGSGRCSRSVSPARTFISNR